MHSCTSSVEDGITAHKMANSGSASHCPRNISKALRIPKLREEPPDMFSMGHPMLQLKLAHFSVTIVSSQPLKSNLDARRRSLEYSRSPQSRRDSWSPWELQPVGKRSRGLLCSASPYHILIRLFLTIFFIAFIVIAIAITSFHISMPRGILAGRRGVRGARRRVRELHHARDRLIRLLRGARGLRGREKGQQQQSREHLKGPRAAKGGQWAASDVT